MGYETPTAAQLAENRVQFGAQVDAIREANATRTSVNALHTPTMGENHNPELPWPTHHYVGSTALAGSL